MNYKNDKPIKDLDKWRAQGGVTTFSVLRHILHEPYMGCNNPAAGPRFFIPQEFINKRII